jgi:hypothetical protein
MTGAILTLSTGSATRQVDLASYLGGDQEEAAAAGASAWIKSVRCARVDGLSLRRRFTHREDSLWWFAELYLHKQQVVLNVFRTIAALDALIDREQPSTMSVVEGNRLVRLIAARFAAARGVRFSGDAPRRPSLASLAAMDARGSWLQGAALASRLRRRPQAGGHRTATVLAFVHRAFWRAEVDDGGAEQYIGPVLKALEARLPGGGLQYVSLGPSANFRARRWWHAVVGDGRAGSAPPVEAFASLDTLRPSTRLWRERHVLRRALWGSDDLRSIARIQGCDCWPVIRDELAGIALLQWPWSARAMDEAGAALDALGPSAALTYAEAGGWGRAIVLECRRRGIPTAGLQHGFIYRHWLNYLHEPDEMAGDPEHPADAGFPHPSVTLLFDAYAARHLSDEGHFPKDTLRVTGSPRLDDLVRATRSLSPDDVARARAQAGAGASDALLIVATKCKEAQQVLPGVLLAASRLPGVHVAIKAHPAETADAYRGAAQGLPRVTVLPAAAPLAPLLAGSRAVITVNSTVALDAAVLGVPSLVVGLPNNLSPFVAAGLMAGAGSGDPAGVLWRILYDEGFRQQLDAARQAFLSRFQIRSDGQAAERSAVAVLQLVNGPAPRKSEG